MYLHSVHWGQLMMPIHSGHESVLKRQFNQISQKQKQLGLYMCFFACRSHSCGQHFPAVHLFLRAVLYVCALVLCMCYPFVALIANLTPGHGATFENWPFG